MRSSSEDILLPQLLAEGSSVYVFGEQRIFCPRYIATVLRATDEFLELKLDPDDLNDARIRKGQQVLLGFAVVRRQMRFGAAVMALSVQERGVLVVSAPEKIEKSPQRGYVRAALTVPCELSLSIAGDQASFTGTTADVSASGARVRVMPSCGGADLLGVKGMLKLYFPERDPIETVCRVVRQLSPTDEDSCSFAVQYENMHEQDEMQIQLLVLRATARRFLRVEASVPCKLEVSDSDGRRTQYVGVSENVSAGGMLINFNDSVPVAPGNRVALELSLPSRYLAVANAEVVRAGQSDDVTKVALSFGRLEELDYQSLIRFVIGQLRGVADAEVHEAAPGTDSFPLLTED